MNTIVVGMGYGDEGKGTITEFLCEHKKADLVIKYSGGYQAAHNVYDRIHHCFSQFGSGTMLQVPTFIDENFIIGIGNLINEAQHLKDNGFKSLELLTVHPECPIATPFDVIVNRARRSGNTCGLGIAEVRQRELDGVSFRAKDYKNLDRLQDVYHYYTKNLSTYLDPDSWPRVLKMYQGQLAALNNQLNVSECPKFNNAVFEGSQGVLLDETHGEDGYNTWSNTTSKHAEDLCNKLGLPYEICGVIRTYHTRHGDGPFPKYEIELNPEEDNVSNNYQGKFKIAPFNEELWKRAKSIQHYNYLATTHNELYLDINTDINTAAIKSFGKRRKDKWTTLKG